MDERERDAEAQEPERAQDEVELPEERVADLSPGEDDSEEVKGGAWPKKVEGSGG